MLIFFIVLYPKGIWEIYIAMHKTGIKYSLPNFGANKMRFLKNCQKCVSFLKNSFMFRILWLWVCNLGHEILKCHSEPTFWDFAFFAAGGGSLLKFRSFVVPTKLLKAFQAEWSFEHERCCCLGKQTQFWKLLRQTCVFLCPQQIIFASKKNWDSLKTMHRHLKRL